MLKHILRILSSVLLCLLLVTACAFAEDSGHHVYIAVDSGSDRSMLPLAGLLAYQAEQNGSIVQLVDLYEPSGSPVYSNDSGITLTDAINGYEGKKLGEDKRKVHISNFLQTFFAPPSDLSAPSDVYILSGYDREDMVSGTWDEDTVSFAQKALNQAYSAVNESMEMNPQLRIHFLYGGAKENEADKLDEKLHEIYTDRIRIAFPSKDEGVSNPAAITEILFSDAAAYAQDAKELVPTDGKIPYRSTSARTWLRMEFDASSAPTHVQFIAEGETSLPIPAFLEPRAAKSKDPYCYWLLLPEGTPDGELVLTDNENAACNTACALTATTELVASSLTLCVDAEQVLVPDELHTLPNESIRLTLSIDHPGFESEDLFPSLAYAFNVMDETGNPIMDEVGNPVLESTQLILTPDETQTNTWYADLLPFAIGCKGEFHASYTVWNQSLHKQVYPFIIGNRAPELNAGTAQPLPLTAYYDLPGKASLPMTFDLSPYFTDPDVSDQPSLFEMEANEDSHDFKTSGNLLIYTAKRALGSETADGVLVNVIDKNGAQTPFHISVKHQSIRELLNALKMELPTELVIPINVSKQYDLTLPAEKISAVNVAFSALSLPPLEEALRVYVNDEPKDLAIAEDGSFVLSIPVAPSGSAGEQTFTLRASLELPDVEPSVLENLFAAREFTVRFSNTSPSIKEGVVVEQRKESDISGFPGSYHAVSFEALFGSLRLCDLFENAEDEQLIYQLKAPKDAVLVNGSWGCSEFGEDIVYSFDSEAAAQPLDVKFLTPGEMTIELTVVDTGNQAPAETIRYHVTLKSVFTRIAIIVAVVAFVLILATIATLLIIERLRPSFEGAMADISNMRTQAEDKWFSLQNYTSIPLSSYAKKPVTLMTLLAASGQLPPMNCDASILTHIIFAPEKNGRFRVTCSGSAAKDAAMLFIDGKPSDTARIIFGENQELSIRFASAPRNETIFIHIYRR